MKFAKLTHIFQIHDKKCVVSSEIDVGEWNLSWDWFTDGIFLMVKELLTPIIKEFLQGTKHIHFNNEFDSSPMEFLAGSPFHVAYFFKKANLSVNPCLIRCELENKYKPVNVSSVKLFASLCQTSLTDVEMQQTFLKNQLKPNFGKSKWSPESNYGISSYFTKTDVKNQIKSQAISSRVEVPFEFKNRLNCEQTENDTKTDLISVCDPFVSTQEDLRRELSDDDFEVPFKEIRTASNSVDFIKNTGTTLLEIQPNEDLTPRKSVLNVLSKHAKTGGGKEENYVSLSENVCYDFGELESKKELEVTNQYKILNVNDEESADKANEKTSKYFNSNKRKLDNGANKAMDMKTLDSILSELEKPDPVIDRLIAESKTKKLAAVFKRDFTDSSGKDDSFELAKSNRRCRKLRKPSVAKRKDDGSKVKKIVKLDNVKNKTLLDWKLKKTHAITVPECDKCESDSDNSLPPALRIDEDHQPSRSDVLENLSELSKSNGKDTKVYRVDEIDSDLIEIDITDEKISVVKEMQNLTTEQLGSMIAQNKDYLKEILKGKSSSRRHQDYIKGGKIRRDLIDHLFLTMYTDSQVDFIMETLMDTFSKNTKKYNDYLFKVLLAETLIKILMDYKDLSYDEAERMSFLARIT